ncbi:hypothetical protein [uncultured Ruminococcus sp.]|nr:hypothetical protein [uncultured Ruminococcus sp.]
MDYSLMFPQNANQSYKTLTPESVNDLARHGRPRGHTLPLRCFRGLSALS